MTEKDKYRTKEEEAQNTKEPDEDATDPTGSYDTPTREDIASGNFADPFASTDQSPGGRHEEGAREEALSGQEGDQQQGSQQSTEEILQGAQDETQVPEQEVTLESPLEQETARDRFADAGLLPDHSPPGMDQLADAADDTGAPGLPTGKEGISDDYRVWSPDGEGGYFKSFEAPWDPVPGEEEIFSVEIDHEGGESRIEGKDDWGPFVRWETKDGSQTYYEHGQEVIQEKDQPPGEEAGQQDRPEPQSTPQDSDGVLSYETVDALGDDINRLFGIDTSEQGETGGSSGSGGAAGGGAGQPDPEGEMTPEEWAQQRASYDALLPPELRTDTWLQNATGRGPGGGEEVNPGREGGTEYGVSTGEATGAQDQQQSMVGNPGTDESSSGAKSGSTSGGDQGGYTDPADDALSGGEMGLTEDPLDVQPSDASSLLEDGDDEGGHGFTKGDFSAEQLRAAQWTLYDSEEEDTADDTYDDAGI